MKKHVVATFTAEGKLIYKEDFNTAEEAFKEYQAVIKSLKGYPRKESVTVARYNDGVLMTLEEIH